MHTLNDQRAFASESIIRLMRLALEAPDLGSAVSPTLQELVDRTAASGSAYFHSSNQVPTYHARAAAGALPEGPAMDAIMAHGLPADTPLMQALTHTRLPLFFDDTASVPEAAGFPALGVRSLAAAPVRHRNGSLIGAFLMHTFSPHAWSSDEAGLFTAVAETLAGLTARLAAEEDAVAAQESALRALGLGLEFKDHETLGHTDRVTDLALRLGRYLNLDTRTLQALRWGSYLHDVGKLAVPDQVLLKPGQLDAAEWDIMRGHVREGTRFADALGFLPPSAHDVISGHHERWDGQGYPNRLAGMQIPLVARIFALCDVYDALTSNRPYKRAWTPQEAQAELAAQSGRHFDPDLCRAFLELLESKASDHQGP
ncbi:HD domain-containing protein (plasmid) [Deinococcus sp. KNUC1210]|uniref:HD-GYP domain-containing protein n=1 Tax=Deinococcus sp. KNUC1210 TaxID=2917691 RepID=UPI001EEFDB07|nr:HD domain-containing phosphohydrolase [Deinococcus sp. KNUC1210]ULH13906.1 HD domain-containing protein [Deinococcus sp. KNUC1210]